MPQRSAGRPARVGRRYLPPVERARPEAPSRDPRIGAAWLLGQTRTCANDGALTRRRDFLEALAEAGLVANETRLSRWESGASPIPAHVVAAYEAVLGSTPYLLRGAIDISRPLGEPLLGLVLASPVDPQRMDQVFDICLAGEPDGFAWLELAQRLASMPHTFLRQSDWSSLAQRLLTEHANAVWTGYTLRTVALGELINHTKMQRHLLRALGELVLEDAPGRHAPALALLARVPGDPTSALALKLLEADDPAVSTAAAHVIAELLVNGGFDAALLERLERRVTAGLQRLPDHAGMLDVATRLSPASAARVVDRTRSRALRGALSTYELVEQRTAVAVARSIANDVRAHVVSADPFADEFLTAICRDSLFHVHRARRHAATMLLAASPYRAAAAAAAAAAVARAESQVVAESLTLVAALLGDANPSRLPLLRTTPSAADWLVH